MNYAHVDDQLRFWEKAYRPLCDFDAATPFGLRKDPPAAPGEITALETALGMPLPPSLRAFLLTYSRDLTFSAFLKDDFCAGLPPALRDIFSAGIDVSLTGIAAAETTRKDWIASCFSNPDDAYDRVYHDKLGFLSIDNGDLLAFDLADGKADHRVVYLSHDDGEGHGCALGDTFADFLERYAAVGLCGPEEWQMRPFIRDKTSGIDPACPNALLYRRLVVQEAARP